MKRRDATALLTALAGGSLSSLSVLLPACKEIEETDTLHFFRREELDLLEAVSETILPDTPRSPGAAAAGIGPFMDRYVADCLEESAQNTLREGFVHLNEGCREQFGKTFLKLSGEEQHDFLVALDIEAETHRPQAGAPPHYFSLFKGLTLLGYFTSEVGATQALRYLAVPGKYEGDIPYKNGERSWAI